MALPSPSWREAWWEVNSERQNKSYLCIGKGASDGDRKRRTQTVLFTELTITETGSGVVIDHTDGLHEGVADGAADESKAAFFQVFAHGVGDLGGGWEADMSFPRVLDGLAANERPNVFVEGAEFFLDLQQGLCVADGGLDFQAIANDSGIFQ